jgi:hypothetical protein
VELFANVNVYGKNILSSEGGCWRHQRKILAPYLAEQNNQIVCNETPHQTGDVINLGLDQEQKQSSTIKSLPEGTTRLDLHVISKSGFGQLLLWPAAESTPGAGKGTLERRTSDEVNPGHVMSYTDVLKLLLHRNMFVVGIPKVILSKSLTRIGEVFELRRLTTLQRVHAHHLLNVFLQAYEAFLCSKNTVAFLILHLGSRKPAHQYDVPLRDIRLPAVEEDLA